MHDVLDHLAITLQMVRLSAHISNLHRILSMRVWRSVNERLKCMCTGKCRLVWAEMVQAYKAVTYYPMALQDGHGALGMDVVVVRDKVVI